MRLEIVEADGSFAVEGMLELYFGDNQTPIKITVEDLFNKLSKPDTEVSQAVKDDFDKVWKVYKRHDNKAKALKAWCRLKPKDRTAVIERVAAFVRAHPDVIYRPMLSTFLNARRWEDELPADKLVQSSPNKPWAQPNTWGR